MQSKSLMSPVDFPLSCRYSQAMGFMRDLRNAYIVDSQYHQSVPRRVTTPRLAKPSIPSESSTSLVIIRIRLLSAPDCGSTSCWAWTSSRCQNHRQRVGVPEVKGCTNYFSWTEYSFKFPINPFPSSANSLLRLSKNVAMVVRSLQPSFDKLTPALTRWYTTSGVSAVV